MQIDWLTVAAQIVNLLVLVWLLQRFLYRPITMAMAEREARIAARLSEAAEARDKVKAEAAQLQEKHEKLDARRDDILRKAHEDADALRKEMEAKLDTEMQAKRDTWEDQLTDAQEDFIATVKQRAGHQVIEIVGRILKDYANADLAGQVAGNFADRLAELDAKARDKLEAAARRADGPIRVESSVPLPPAMRGRITRAIHKHIAPDIAVDYAQDADLLLGLRLIAGEQRVEWSATRFLSRLETTLDEIIESRTRHRTKRPADTAEPG